MYVLHTPEDFRFNKFWLSPVTGQTDMTFKLEACQNAHVVLSKQPADLNSALTINIGAMSNTITTVTNSNGTVLKSEVSPLILDCARLSPFWIQWDKRITLGQGKRFGDIVISYSPYVNPTDIPVSTLSFATSVTRRGGFWRFPVNQSKYRGNPCSINDMN